MIKKLVGLVVLLAVVAGAGVWYFFIRDDSPPEATLADRPTVEGASDGIEGAWTVATGPETFAGFRIVEDFPGFENTAVVRTPLVRGTMTVAGTDITEVSVTADLTGLESKDPQPPGVPGIENRVSQMQDDGLEISSFPTATFELTEPIALGEQPEVGQEIQATAVGDLTIHGETQSVSVPVTARWNGEVVDVVGSLPVVLADHGIAKVTRPFVTVADEGTMELQLTFARS